MSETRSNPGSIAIIGAGMAGLSCAAGLKAAGYAVVVYEKSRGLGGRMSTRRGIGWQCDHGAPGFSASSADFRAQVARWRDAGLVQGWNPNATDGSEAGSCFVGVPRMNAPLRQLALDLDIRMGHRVIAMQAEKHGWLLSIDGEATQRHEAVVLSSPPAQAAALLDGVARDYCEIARSVDMAPCWVVMAQYRESPQQTEVASSVLDGALVRVVHDRDKPQRAGPDSWLLIAGASWSKQYLESDPGWVSDQLVADFCRAGAPRPTTAVAHRWRYAQTTTPAHLGHLWDSHRGLGLCGDWLSDGTIEGAWRSGRGLYDAIANRS